MEVVDAIGELKALPEGIHLLCPRQSPEDYNSYDDLTQTEDGKSVAEIVTEATARKQKFLSSMRILAYNADGVEELQSWVLSSLDHSLENCDLCIKEYYTGKVWLVDLLKEENYQEEDIEAFAQRLDEWDIKRITRNLARATTQLEAAPKEKIGVGSVDRAALLSIFETLSCKAMICNDTLLQEHFDVPFKLLQTKRTLKIPSYVPAVTYFLFESNQLRSNWAISAWTRYTQPPTTAEFEWAIRDGLLNALRVASQAAAQQPPQTQVIQRLWRGMQLILMKLEPEQITHHLRGLEIDPLRLSVDHLGFPTPGLRFLLNTIQSFLVKAPADFWDAMQTISPQALIEHTFHNPQFGIFLMQVQEGEAWDKSNLKDILSWINPFLSSLKGAHQPPACRALALPLLKQFQDPRFPNLARYHCFRTGLESLLQTLQFFTKDEASRGSVARVVLKETMGVLEDTIQIILSPPTFAIAENLQKEIVSLCMDVVRNTLALECQSLKSDYEVILRHGTLSHGVSTYSARIWDAVIARLRPDNLPLSTSALLGILPLVGLEKFTTRGEAKQEKTHFNMIYGHLTHLSCQIIERLSDFPPEHLDKLFSVQDTASALISTLFAADLNTYQASVDLIKNVSGQSARQDAISHLLQKFFLPTMYGLSWSFRRISNMKTFAPAPRMLHTGTDLVEILCNSQTGILRTRTLSDRREVLSLLKLWEFLWSALSTIFEQTEAWHMRGNEKSVMLEFCRDTIQFADYLFDQYGVFLGAVEGTETGQKSPSEAFLKSPTDTMGSMVKWLRLKDEYLATTLVGLVSKLLRRLGGFKVEVNEETLAAIEGVAVNATIKTILSLRDKSELVRSLEAYLGKSVVSASTASLKKQSSITSFARPSDPLSASSSRPASDEDFDDLPDSTLLELSRSVELNKDRRAAQALAQAKSKRKSEPSSTMAPAVDKPILPVKRASHVPPLRPYNDPTHVLSFRETREREKEAKKRRDMFELARQKGHLMGQTAEQGSGLKGIGIKGKDHSIPVDSMMVSSGSDTDSSSEDEMDEAIFGAKPKKAEAVMAYERSKKQSLRMPVRKIKRQRSAKDMRARLAPDLSELHHSILSWDYFATGDQPPSVDRDDFTLVSNTFRSPTDYQKTFQPLLVLEAWQGFQASKEEGPFRPFEVKITSRLTVDRWTEFSTQPKGLPLENFSLGEGDLVLFSSSSRPTEDSQAGHLLARVSKVTRQGGKLEATYRMNPSSGNPSSVLNKFHSSLTTGAFAWATKITSLIPVEREYGALSALQYYDLCEEIVLAKPSPLLTYAESTIKPIMNNYSLNLAQSKAIKSAMDNDAFTLIQGPPGSGKTKTITALVGSLLSNTLEKAGVSIGSAYNPARPPTPRKILVCAPSNAAVDELVMRLKSGVKTIRGREENITVVRLGRADAINANVLDVSLDELVAARLNKDPASSGTKVDMQKLYEEHKKVDATFKETRSQLDEYREKGLSPPEELQHQFGLLKKNRAELSADIDKGRDRTHTATRNADMRKKTVQREIIESAHVICTTLSGSGHDIFQSMSIEFETVIIDEAAQCIELSALIPLKYGCSKCVLVGDPKQLPPTVLSKVASKYQYEQSLFVRMQKNHPQDVHLLDVQYRMHPDISRYPSLAFYDSKLQDGPDMAKINKRPWHKSELLSPYRFFDVQGMHQSAAKGHSLINHAEVQAAMQLYERLTTDVSTYDFDGKIGIITPYKGQLRELRIRFGQRYGEDILKKVDFNTTDAFQGRESEVIIFSCVRASNKGIGFLSDIRRMNVGLTRAKTSLWVLGNSQSLEQGEYWRGLITDARTRQLYTSGNILRLLSKPQVILEDIEESDAEDAEAGNDGNTTSPPTDSASVPSTTTRPPSATPPMRPPDGPSGGSTGLDESKMCGYCGSNKHFSHNCDNEDAKAASRGKCFRCGEEGHSKMGCMANRCLECGKFGHSFFMCQEPRLLSNQQKRQIKAQEKDWQEMKRKSAERRKQNPHDRKIPSVQATGNAPKTDEAAGGKRKRTETSAPEAPKASRPRTEAPPPPTDLIKPSRDGPTAQLATKSPQTIPAGPNPTASSNKAPPKPRPMIRKKKEVDPFIRPKRR